MTLQERAPGSGSLPDRGAPSAPTAPVRLGEWGGHARVVEILATEQSGESIAVARSMLDDELVIEIRVRYLSWLHPVKIGDAIEYTCGLVSEPLPDQAPRCRCRTAATARH